VKQWEPEKFGDVARRLAAKRDATIVLTGSKPDRSLVDSIRKAVPAGQVVDVAGEIDLLLLAALLQRMDLLITGDTGPMHLATAVGTPVVAVFGPSDPRRYAPAGAADRIVRIVLPCSPCNRIRLPPVRCTGHTPDCLAGIPADAVFEAALSVLDHSSHAEAPGHSTA
jgi:ADP-heptose:LPS heptosyltransferase